MAESQETLYYPAQDHFGPLILEGRAGYWSNRTERSNKNGQKMFCFQCE